MPPAGGRRGERRKNPLWALLTSCTSCKSDQRPSEVTIEDGPAPAKAGSSRKKGRNKRRRAKAAAQDGDAVSTGSWDTIDEANRSVDTHEVNPHLLIPSTSTTSPMPADLGNDIQKRGTKLEASPLLKQRRPQQMDAGVQTEGSSDEKENLRPDGTKPRRKNNLNSPRLRRKHEKQTSDDEDYASDRSDGKSSPKRRRRRKYSDVVRVERIFIEKNMHTKEEVIIDKLRKRKSRSKESINLDGENPLEISNYDSESEVPLNRSHRIASMQSLNKDADSFGLQKDTNLSSSSEDKGTNTDPKKLPTRLILQHIKHNTLETSDTETVSSLPSMPEPASVIAQKTAPSMTNVGPDGTSVDPMRPVVGGVMPESIHLDTRRPYGNSNKEIEALQGQPSKTRMEDQLTGIHPTLDDAKPSEQTTSIVLPKEQLLHQDQVLVAENAANESFPEDMGQVEYASVERSPTLERKSQVHDTSKCDSSFDATENLPVLTQKTGLVSSTVESEHVLHKASCDVKLPKTAKVIDGIQEQTMEMPSSKSFQTGKDIDSIQDVAQSTPGVTPGVYNTSDRATATILGADNSFKSANTQTFADQTKCDSEVQTHNIQDFSPVVVNQFAGIQEQETNLYEMKLPETADVVPGNVPMTSEMIAGMRTHGPIVMKAEKPGIVAQNNPMDDQSSSAPLAMSSTVKESQKGSNALEGDIGGYDTFKANLHARMGIIESSSIEDLADAKKKKGPTSTLR